MKSPVQSSLENHNSEWTKTYETMISIAACFQDKLKEIELLYEATAQNSKINDCET